MAKVNEDGRAQLVEELGIDLIVSAKTATADAIMSYVRARRILSRMSMLNLCISWLAEE